MAQIEETRYEPDLKRHWPVAAVVVLFAFGMFGLAAYGVHMTRPPFGTPGLRFVCGALPVILGVLILLSLVGVYRAYSTLVIIMRRDNFVFEISGTIHRRRWRNVSLTRSDPNNSSPFASSMLSDGEGFYRLYRFVYKNYDELLDDLDRERTAGRGEHSL